MNTVLDPVAALFTPGSTHAQVGISVGTQIDFGRIKVTAHVNYTCDQTEAKVNTAGEMAFNKALEFMNDGLSVILTDEKK